MLIPPSSSSKTNVRTTSGLRTMQNLPKVPGGEDGAGVVVVVVGGVMVVVVDHKTGCYSR